MNWQRARTDEKKNERKEAVYKAAFSLFKAKGYENVSFNAIATEAGFTKSNVYRYFDSKEDIFLLIFAELFENWFKECNERLGNLKQNAPESDFAKVWVDTMSVQPKFLDLIPILFVSLENNSSYEQLLNFKRLSKGLLYQLTIEISRIYPEIQDEQAFKLLTMSYAATGNYWAAATKNNTLNRIYQQEEFQDLKPNFEYELSTAIEIIIKGLKAG